jgi:hypothetical protein
MKVILSLQYLHSKKLKHTVILTIGMRNSGHHSVLLVWQRFRAGGSVCSRKRLATHWCRLRRKCLSLSRIQVPYEGNPGQKDGIIFLTYVWANLKIILNDFGWFSFHLLQNVTSINFNPNKWLLVNFDCSLLWWVWSWCLFFFSIQFLTCFVLCIFMRYMYDAYLTSSWP